MKQKGLLFLTLLTVSALLLGSFSVSGNTAGAASAQQDMMNAYYKVTAQLIEKEGIAVEEDLESVRGLAYADLIDFDKNGVQELFLVYFKDGYHYEEVWTYQKNKAARIYAYKWPTSGRGFDQSVSLAEGKKNVYIVHAGGYTDTGTGGSRYITYYDDISFATYSGGKFAGVLKLGKQTVEDEETSKWTTSYFLNQNNKQKSISQKTYDQYLADNGYGKRKHVIDSDGTGYQTIAFDITNNGKTIFDFLQKLKNGMRASAFKNTVQEWKTADKNELTAFLHKFSIMRNLEMGKNADDHMASFLVEGTFDGTITDEELAQNGAVEPIVDENGFYYYPYREADVTNWTKRIFGRAIAAKNYDHVLYRNGNFYILSPEKGGDPSVYSPQVTALYSLGKGQYYAEFVLFSFEWEYQDPFFESEKHKKSMDTWTADEKAEAYSTLQYGITNGYAILKQVTADGKKAWNLVSYHTEEPYLTNEQINALKK